MFRILLCCCCYNEETRAFIVSLKIPHHLLSSINLIYLFVNTDVFGIRKKNINMQISIHIHFLFGYLCKIA